METRQSPTGEERIDSGFLAPGPHSERGVRPLSPGLHKTSLGTPGERWQNHAPSRNASISPKITKPPPPGERTVASSPSTAPSGNHLPGAGLLLRWLCLRLRGKSFQNHNQGQSDEGRGGRQWCCLVTSGLGLGVGGAITELRKTREWLGGPLALAMAPWQVSAILALASEPGAFAPLPSGPA